MVIFSLIYSLCLGGHKVFIILVIQRNYARSDTNKRK
uniref:Uncharacterized protein n=1 Tax=Rhizophora mucronata TaxID=61149 RepID=A0A2P2NVA1_RHIMU